MPEKLTVTGLQYLRGIPPTLDYIAQRILNQGILRSFSRPAVLLSPVAEPLLLKFIDYGPVLEAVSLGATRAGRSAIRIHPDEYLLAVETLRNSSSLRVHQLSEISQCTHTWQEYNYPA